MTETSIQKKPKKELAMSGDKVSQFKESISRGLTIKESLAFSGISYRAWRTYKKYNPCILEDIEVLKHLPSVKAKFTVTDEIKRGNVAVSQWWLERKNANEFCLKTINENKNDTTINIQMADFSSEKASSKEDTTKEEEIHVS
tara:strand:+ start:613 stop:1041 length:429 start_codon:yes stop_codon:yes gene_type:complete